ncbi:MAG: thermonuclease family protein [Fuerstiella sp.]
MPLPEPQIVIPKCTVSDVIDGDTVELELRRKVRVRLKDVWAPESRMTRHPSEKALGLQAKDILHWIAMGEECVLRVTPDGDEDLGDGLTFGRVVGEVHLKSELSLNEFMIASGQAFRTKQELEEYLTEQDREHHDAM